MTKTLSISKKYSLMLGVSLLFVPNLSHAQGMEYNAEMDMQETSQMPDEMAQMPEGTPEMSDEMAPFDADLMPMPEQMENSEEDFLAEMDVMPEIEPPEQAQLEAIPATPEINAGPVAIPHSGAYYDASSFGATSISDTAPREVDPKYEPGTRFVVVEKSASAGSFSAQLVSAQRALSLGRYASALEMYEDLYQKNPKNTRVLMGLAVAQQRGGFTESALATYEELLKLDPDNADATVNMLGIISSVNPQSAYVRLQDMWATNNRNPAIASQLGFTAAELGDYDRAIRYLGIASSMEPTNPNHYYNMAVISDRAGMIQNAIEYYQKSLDMDASTNAFKTVSREVVYDRLATLRRL